MQTTLSLDSVRSALREVCARHPVEQVELFGSMVRGEQDQDSDVDLLVKFLPGENAGLFAMGALKEDIEERLGRKVDLLSRQAVEQSSNAFRRRAVLSAPVIVYAR